MNNEKLKMMRDEKISKVLLKMGIPTMIGMMVSALYNVVDAYFVGGLGTSQMGAVSITFPIAQVIVGLGMTFGNGAASYISRLLGEENEIKANETASTALVSSLIVGIISIAVSLCFLDNILIGLGATKTILPYAREFAVIYITGSILNIFSVTMNNIVTSEGMAKLTMTSMLLSGIFNIILNPILIYSLGFGIKGSAISTVISQALASILYIWYMLNKKGSLRFSIYNFRFDSTIFIQIFKVGIPILVYQLLSSASMGLSNTAARSYGDSAVAAIGVVTRIMALGSYVVFGFMKGYQPVAGYNYGAKNYDRLNEATKVSLKWATIFCTVIALILIMVPDQIVSLFSKNDAVLINIGGRALRANGIIFILFGFEQVYMCLFLALGMGKEGGILSISRQGMFFIPAILVMPQFLGIEGVIWAQPAADLLTVILTALFMLGVNKKLNNFMNQKEYLN
ncbi:MATE family efflux transporter [Clostridium autoethanogenum DSM 10061]|uniref:Multidrug export protein MepA n=1 Tax=Clostridium autoethanogenum DSM 10061 TaxID=1341692 RepID=A0ABM5NSW3_9CLOT|nr:MATE family efflux transporter [Clostridium autoethanogenum]AGY75433.2 MATE family efflux transporter [Clostridium autoethanogenum DSM 10061]